ncbi:hypothetical protein O9G_004324 [Rozella allomycis CSF55]|uniref:Uncharacterized protein n=1 Tax=Rozella allomycis (strain CSF55) TaxID=988480 RepID=A0A075AVC4_ROZAC|nr:hypothetical protein O9G_004324 [Rozella allomycis CSF55]|eukprot:EPZ34208.1 hypothetical protein O9G_004324 [Rozella allomycis CSF55]
MNKIARDYVELKSECNCPEQAVHSDYDTSLSYQFAENFPLGAILALEHGTRLKVCKGSINTVTVTKEQMMEAIFHMPAVITRMRTQEYIFVFAQRREHKHSGHVYLEEKDDYLPSFSVAVAPENNEYAYNSRSASKLNPSQ